MLLLPRDERVEADETTIDAPATVPTKPTLNPAPAANSCAPLIVQEVPVILTAVIWMLYDVVDVTITADATDITTPLTAPVVVI